MVGGGERSGTWASSPGVRRGMQANKRRDTGPEMRIRRALHARGYRFRVDFRPVGGSTARPDIAFTRYRVAIFIDGCFWHGCPEHYVAAKTNSDYWIAKVRANRARDERQTRELREAGWRVLRIWEHETLETSLDEIVTLLRQAGRSA